MSEICSSCNKCFTRKGDLVRHEQLHTGVRPHVCEHCGKAFAQLSGLNVHRNTHTKAKPYKCGINFCTAKFGDPSSRSRHRKESHNSGPGYSCPSLGCTSRIKRRSAFAAHIKKRHGLDPKKYLLDLPSAIPSSDLRPSHKILKEQGRRWQDAPEERFEDRSEDTVNICNDSYLQASPEVISTPFLGEKPLIGGLARPVRPYTPELCYLSDSPTPSLSPQIQFISPRAFGCSSPNGSLSPDVPFDVSRPSACLDSGLLLSKAPPCEPFDSYRGPPSPLDEFSCTLDHVITF